MAAWDHADPLFRFVHVRAPDVLRPPSHLQLPRVRVYFPDNLTALHAALQTAATAGSRGDMTELARRFVSDADRTDFGGAVFRGMRESIDPWFWSLDDYLVGLRDQPAVVDFEKILIGMLGASDVFYPDNEILWPVFRDALEALWRDVSDSIIAASIWPLVSPASQALLMRAIRLICLLNDIASLEWTPPTKPDGKPATALADLITTDRIRVTLLDGLVLLPADLFQPPDAAAAPAAPLPAPAGGGRRNQGTVLLRRQLARAADDLSRALRAVGDVKSRANVREHVPMVADARPYLSADTMAVVRAQAGMQEMPLPEAISVLDHRASLAPGVPLAAPEPPRVAAMRILNRRDLTGIHVTGGFTGVNLGDWSAAGLTRTPVVGDLLVVQQELLRYEAAEIADIENILAKERKLHVHHYKELQEQETTITTEHEEDRTHDNQTTDRQELSQEASRQVQTQMAFGAGVSVSASYGSVQIAANVNFSYATSSAESNRSASTFSKEVVDRSVQTIKDRRIEQRRSLRRQKMLDRNEHELNNETSENIIGIYQWVEKVYEAATFNYGRRMMLDMTVPEPALYLQFAQKLAAAAIVSADPPPALEIVDPANGVTREITADDIGELIDISELASRFRVRGLRPPPPRWAITSLKLGEDAQPPADKTADQLQTLFTKADYIKVPVNYVPSWYKATVNLLINFGQNDSIVSANTGSNATRDTYSRNIGNGPDGTQLPHWTAYSRNVAGVNTLAVGPFLDDLIAGLPNTISHAFSEQQQLTGAVALADTGDPSQPGTIPVALSVLGSPIYVATVTLVSERTEAAYKAWQLEQYEALVTAWEAWKQEFETAVRAAQNAAASNAAYPASTNSALADSQISTEMRRLFLQMLQVPGIGVGGAVSQPDLSDPTAPVPPQLNPTLAAAIGRQIQFVEQAFEWPQLTYRLYPYYWKPQTAWPAAMSINDPNPAFGDFLRAGSARMVVPVRPGFEIAVCSHLGINPPLPWGAGKPPIIDADPYISIAEEIKSAQTDLTIPQRVDTPWIVRLPTTLVKLKEDSELPIFREPTPVPPPPAPGP